MKSRNHPLLPFVSNRINTYLLLQTAMLCLGLAISHTSIAAATNDISHDELKLSIAEYVKQQFSADFRVHTEVGKIDPHLRLSSCEQALETFYPIGARKLGPTNIGIRCTGNNPWTIYLPVNIKVYGQTVVSKLPLTRNTVLNASDLTLATRELSRATNGYFTRIAELEGMTLRRSIARGSILQPSIVKQRHMVKRGDFITILAESNGISIRVKGKAMMDGFRGQSIRIRNYRSRRELQGEVIAPGTVRVNL